MQALTDHWVECPVLCSRSFLVTTLAPLGFPCGSAGKESTCNAGDVGSIPGSGRFPWRRDRIPTPVFWPGEFHELDSPWGRKESDTTEQLSVTFFHFPVQCYAPQSIVLQVFCLSDLIPWIYLSLPLYNRNRFDLGHTWMSSGFPYFLQFKFEFCNKELMIWATDHVFANCKELFHLWLQKI